MSANLTKAEQYTEELKIAKRHASQLGALSKESRERVRELINVLLTETIPAPNGSESVDNPTF